jgi:hypothetical protein
MSISVSDGMLVCLSCEECDRLTEIYLTAVTKYNEQARRIGDLKSEASREATREMREGCQRAQADLKSYKQEHDC